MNDVNREVAEKVMGWHHELSPFLPDGWDSNKSGYWVDDKTVIMPVCNFDPLHKIEHAWIVVEKLRKESYWLYLYQYASKQAQWRAFFEYGGMTVGGKWIYLEADTAPEAICRAALAAKEGEHE